MSFSDSKVFDTFLFRDRRRVHPRLLCWRFLLCRELRSYFRDWDYRGEQIWMDWGVGGCGLVRQDMVDRCTPWFGDDVLAD